jgi:hypothetical protein
MHKYSIHTLRQVVNFSIPEKSLEHIFDSVSLIERCGFRLLIIAKYVLISILTSFILTCAKKKCTIIELCPLKMLTMLTVYVWHYTIITI